MNCPCDAGCICIAINITELHSKQLCPIAFAGLFRWNIGRMKHSASCPLLRPLSQGLCDLLTFLPLPLGEQQGPVLSAMQGEVSCVHLRGLSVGPSLYILHLHLIFLLLDASPISSIQKTGLHLYPPLRESARVSSMSHLSVSLAFII